MKCESPVRPTDRLVTKGDLNLNSGFEAQGPVYADYATIGGNLSLTQGQFEGAPGAAAITMKGAVISGDVLLNQGVLEPGVKILAPFTAHGEVDMSNSRVSGNLLCDGGIFEHSKKKEIDQPDDQSFLYSLMAGNLYTKGGVSLGNGFKSDGVVFFGRAHVETEFTGVGATFLWPSGVKRSAITKAVEIAAAPSLVEASQITVGRGVLFRDCNFDGVVKLIQADIHGDVGLVGSEFTGSAARGPDAAGAQISGTLDWYPKYSAPALGHTVLRLTDTKAAGLRDIGATWPSDGYLIVSGFTYSTVRSDRGAPADRLEWLSRQPAQFRYEPQPFTQLAKVYRERGLEDDSITVLVARERARWRANPSVPPTQPDGGVRRVFRRVLNTLQYSLYPLWSAVLDATIGYGHRPSRAVWWLLLLIFVGWQTFARS